MKKHSFLLAFTPLLFCVCCKPNNGDSKLTQKFKDLNDQIENTDNLTTEQKDKEFHKLWEKEKTDKVEKNILDDFISK